MEQMRVVPTRVHGIVDYIAGLALILAPEIFGFADEGGAAVLIPRVLGVLMLLTALATDYELGLLKMIPMPTHLSLDVLVGLFLAASPFLFDFYDEEANVWLPHVVVGLGEALFALMTRTRPESRIVTPR